MDTVPGNQVQERVNAQSTISRFACRILAQRDENDLTCRIYAAGFDSQRNIFLGTATILSAALFGRRRTRPANDAI